MALNDAQLLAFNSALFAETDPVLVGYRDSGATPLIAAWYNAQRTPALVVWKTKLYLEEIIQNGFDWVRVDNLSVGKARIWEWMFGGEDRSINPSKPNVRAGIAEVWKGTQADLAVQASVLAHCKRNATRIEALFATGTGTTADPATMAFVESLSEYDVSRAMALQV